MANSANATQREIKPRTKVGYRNELCLESVVLDDGSKPEVLLRIIQAIAALTKQKPIWRDNGISLG